MMNELSLFTGASGGVLGSKILGWKTIGYVEYEKYCQEIIKQRIADGILDAAPIFGDIRKFISDGYAASYSGMVDIVTGGFPCQPFSIAGKRAGSDDPRNMWPFTAKTISIIRPKFAFLENVPAILSYGYFGKILRDLAEYGYECRWTCLSAKEIGANHVRDRVWIFAYSASKQDWRIQSKRFQPNTRPGSWWKSEPAIRRVDDGVASRVDRLKAIGNGQVPLCMAYAYAVLSEGIVK